jgi:hypothetical protein
MHAVASVTCVGRFRDFLGFSSVLLSCPRAGFSAPRASGYAPRVAFELTAHRVTADDEGVYDWRIGIGAADDTTHTLILNHVERDRWPAIVREFGLIRVRNIHFRDDRERIQFVQDCALNI